jgi:3-oxoacyl-[acyl-carrier protein] reductase
MDLQLRDKIAIVTGSSRGLGLASARALAEEGCRVTLCARGREKLDEAAAELRSVAGTPDHVLAVLADLSTSEGTERVIASTVEAFGGIDILVNNVGLARGATIVDTTDADWQEAIDQTLFPAIRASRLVVPHLRRRGGGAIVMIASIWGRESGGASRSRWHNSWLATTSASTAWRRGRFSFPEGRGTAVSWRIRWGLPIS